MKTKLTDEDISVIINLYQSEIPNTHILAKKFKVGHKKIASILAAAGVIIRSKGGQKTIGNSSEIEVSKNRLYAPSTDNHKLIAISKKTGEIFDDPNNLSGCLTEHIKNEYGDVPIPTNTYQRKKYETLNNKKWFEEYFEIKEIDIIPITPVIKKENPRLKLFIDTKNYVVCPLCGEKMKIISNTHLLTKHNITQAEFKLSFPNHRLTSETLSNVFRYHTKLANINMKPTWSSKAEQEIKTFIEGLGFVVEKSKNRKLLQGKEIDLVIDDLKLGIEYNGLYYHTEKMGKDANYHLDKILACNAIGYKLIHIFEDEWNNKKDLVKNKLRHLLKKNDGIKIGARKLQIRKITAPEKGLFLKENHIQGNDNSNISYGAFLNNELLGVMTFNGKRNMTKTSVGEYELTRYATKQTYIISGLASKFIKQFIGDYAPHKIISFADRRWTADVKNNLYTNIGFKLCDIVKPNYSYYNSKIDKFRRFHKFGFGKSSLKKSHPELDFSKTEKQLTTELGYDRIWDCGLFKFELTTVFR